MDLSAKFGKEILEICVKQSQDFFPERLGKIPLKIAGDDKKHFGHHVMCCDLAKLAAQSYRADKGITARDFSGLRLYLCYNYSSLFFYHQYSYMKELPSRILKSFLWIQLHDEILLNFQNVAIS